MVKVYDGILIDLLSLPNTELIIATGLSQKPYEKLKFYYRLRDHRAFLEYLGIEFRDAIPRMTRDFLVSFDSVEKAALAERQLSKILVENKVKLFDQIDNRGKDTFVVLTYPFEITEETTITVLGKQLSLHELVTFVAIKNGEHQSKGFAYFSDGISKYAPAQDSHVSRIHGTVLDFFGVRN